MKRVLGIILAVLGCIVFFTFLTWGQMLIGATFGYSVLIILFSVFITVAITGYLYLVLWLLS